MQLKARSAANMKKYALSANQLAAQGAIKFASAAIIVSVVLYAEIMYLQIVSSAFPDGIFRGLAIVGALASGLSVLVLVLGKMFWFPPGGQTIWSWCFTALETIILILNLILSFEIVWQSVDEWMATWRDFSPATPIVALVGWIIIWMLDRSTKVRHAIIEQEEKEVESELDYRGQVHTAVMELRGNYLLQTVENLKDEFSSPDVQRQLRQGARDLAASVLSEFTNIPVVPRPLKRGDTVDADMGSGARQDTPGLPAPKARERTEKEQPEQSSNGFFGRLKAAGEALLGRDQGQDEERGRSSDEAGQATIEDKGDDPPAQEAGVPDPNGKPSQPAPAGASVVLARPRRVVHNVEPSVVEGRRRRRWERLRGGDRESDAASPEVVAESVPEPEGEPVTEALPEVRTPEIKGSEVQQRAKKKLPPLRRGRVF